MQDPLIIELWTILNSCINSYLRIHVGKFGGLSREALEDLAVEKSLDLLRRAKTGEWVVTDRDPKEIAGYLSKVARYGVQEQVRKERRRVLPKDEEREEWDLGETGEGKTMSMMESPDVAVERREFAQALRSCAGGLQSRSRLVWFFRVFYSMSSKEIAAHPRIGLKASHVDVLLMRTREFIRDCMRRKGFASQDMPPGVSIELWQAFQLEGSHETGEVRS